MCGARVLLVLGTTLVLALPTSLLAQTRPPVRVPDNAAFVASSRGQVYYAAQCEAWRDLAPENLMFFESAEEARNAGYRATRSGSCRDPAPPAIGTVGGRTGPTCVVEYIVDGDTLDCEDGPRIRLLLVDAPETEQDGFGLRAALSLESLAPVGSTVVLDLDVQTHDRYGRLLAHLYSGDGTWINHALVRDGYAVVLVVPPNVSGVDALRRAADSARSEEAGLWASGAFRCTPAEVRAGRCSGER